MIPTRTRLGAVLAAYFALSTGWVEGSDEPAVPLQLQAELTVKVVGYVQEPHLQPPDIMHIGILTKAGRPESARFGAELKAALDRVPSIAGHAHDQSMLAFSTALDLVQEVKRQHLFLIYLTPGLGAEILAITQALQRVPVVTIAATDSYVSAGAILGFELLSGHPKMVFNLAQAKKQNIVFGSAVMKLMRLVE
jgi:hypothetical protein